MTSTETRPPARPASRALPAALLTMAFRSLGVLAVLAVPVVSGLGSVDGGAPGARADGQQQSSTWKAAWSERYPGCVPSVLWPDDEHPKALLTRGPDGRIYRFALAPGDDPVTSVPTGARAIGACR